MSADRRPEMPRSNDVTHLRLRGAEMAELTAWLQRHGEPAYRAKQIFQWVFEKGATSFDEMTNLPKALRALLSDKAALGGMAVREVVGKPDETRKLLYEADDGEYVESVLMREEGPVDDEDDEPTGGTARAERLSLCVSSQVGCALNCAFCRTGHGGFRRDLRPDEIVSQVIEGRRMLEAGEALGNLVFMGMGEPLLNLRAVLPVLRLITSPQAVAFSPRRIIVSTAGVIPGIAELGRADTGVNLAVSLNATTQPVRDHIMPGCKRWPIDSLLQACRDFPMAKRRLITFEYVLLRDVNDSPEDRQRLVRLLHGIPCKVNLIVYNPSPELAMEATPEDRAENFRDELLGRGLRASLRRSKGRRLQAACGQLAAHTRKRGRQ